MGVMELSNQFDTIKAYYGEKRRKLKTEIEFQKGWKQEELVTELNFKERKMNVSYIIFGIRIFSGSLIVCNI